MGKLIFRETGHHFLECLPSLKVWELRSDWTRFVSRASVIAVIKNETDLNAVINH